MNSPRLSKLKKRTVSILFPFHNTQDHLCRQSRRTSKELGFPAEMIDAMERLTWQTCNEVKFTGLDQEDRVN